MVYNGLEERRTPGNTLIVQPDKPYQVWPPSPAPTCLQQRPSLPRSPCGRQLLVRGVFQLGLLLAVLALPGCCKGSPDCTCAMAVR